MSYRYTPADVGFLTSAEGASAAADLAGTLALTLDSLVGDIARAGARYGRWASALVDTVALRRRALAKLPAADAERWLFTDDALQQATSHLVARHRAARLAGRRVHDVTCSIGVDLAAVAHTADLVVGSDLDPVRLLMARHNAPGVDVLRADALTPTTRGTVVLADPARRSGGRRTVDPADLEPSLPGLLETYRGRDLVVKCAPGLHPERLDFDGEAEVVSLDGGVREMCLWSAGLAEPGVSSRATILRSNGFVEQVTDREPDDCGIGGPGGGVGGPGGGAGAPGAYVIDPDGAIVRAGLVRHWARRHGLWQLDPRIAHLTGDAIPPGASGFPFLESIPLRPKPLRARLRALDCGPLEILVRGADVDPDQLRKQIKPTGSTPLTVVITRIGSRVTALICGGRVRSTG